jgi:hypothetical protein
VSEILRQREQTDAKIVARTVERASIDKAWVIDRLRENAERAMQARPVFDHEGNKTGEYRYDGAVANRALELIGKEIGMFVTRHEQGKPGEFANLTDNQLKEKFIAQLVEKGMSEKRARDFVGATRGPGRPRKQPADA